jgi:hypothetical protein
MRLGKVRFTYSVAVDLDNPKHIERAKDAILQDLGDPAILGEVGHDDLQVLEDPTLTEADLQAWLLEDTKDEEPLDSVTAALDFGCPRCGSGDTYKVIGSVSDKDGNHGDNILLALCNSCGHAVRNPSTPE